MLRLHEMHKPTDVIWKNPLKHKCYSCENRDQDLLVEHYTVAMVNVMYLIQYISACCAGPVSVFNLLDHSDYNSEILLIHFE